MGFFKDVRTLTKQGHEMQKNMDVNAQMAQGMASMQAASTMMAQQTAAAHLAVNGVPAMATVAAVRPTGMEINLSPVVDIDLMVMRGGAPMPVTHQEPVPTVYLARLQPGAALHVKYDPANPSLVWIDWVTPA
ncbi:MAG: hypothetical protein HZB15_12100 [Actinobacteria bacterium]|nr:hypothetical protein [Actinomycetota bacterium]